MIQNGLCVCVGGGGGGAGREAGEATESCTVCPGGECFLEFLGWDLSVTLDFFAGFGGVCGRWGDVGMDVGPAGCPWCLRF